MHRLLRWLPDGHSSFETSAAALAGFLAGSAVPDGWPLIERLLRLLLGG